MFFKMITTETSLFHDSICVFPFHVTRCYRAQKLETVHPFDRFTIIVMGAIGVFFFLRSTIVVRVLDAFD